MSDEYSFTILSTETVIVRFKQTFHTEGLSPVPSDYCNTCAGLETKIQRIRSELVHMHESRRNSESNIRAKKSVLKSLYHLCKHIGVRQIWKSKCPWQVWPKIKFYTKSSCSQLVTLARLKTFDAKWSNGRAYYFNSLPDQKATTSLEGSCTAGEGVLFSEVRHSHVRRCQLIYSAQSSLHDRWENSWG